MNHPSNAPLFDSAEFEAALKAGHVGRWYVAESYRIENGAVIEDSEEDNPTIRGTIAVPLKTKTVYFPAMRPNLPFELAAIEDGDEESILEFVGRWGLLYGVHGAREPLLLRPGDDLEFIWGHAKTMRMLLELYEALQDDSPQTVRSALAKWTRSGFVFDKNDVKGDGWSVLASWGNNYPKVRVFQPSRFSMTSDRGKALDTIAQVVTENIRGVRRVMLHAGDLSDWHGGTSFEALYQMAYWHIADSLEKQSRVARCQWCGRMFQKIDGRQKFCPPPEANRQQYRDGNLERAQSLCGLKYRQRQLQRKETRNAEAPKP